MTLCTKTVKKKLGNESRPVLVKLSYPYTDGKDKRGKRINAFLDGLFSRFVRYIENGKDRLFTYHECTYKASECKKGLTVFFELEKRGDDGLYSYRPFSVTFNVKGRAVPLFRRIPPGLYGKAKKAFADMGVRLSKKAFLYSYRPDGDGAVVFLPRTGVSGRKRRALAEFRIDSSQF